MTAQRDRLAAVLHDALVDWPIGGCGSVADALFARGIRVVDVETLAAALHRTVYGGEPMDELARRLYTEDADHVLDALDAEP